jgi:hypothetical protein
MPSSRTRSRQKRKGVEGWRVREWCGRLDEEKREKRESENDAEERG